MKKHEFLHKYADFMTNDLHIANQEMEEVNKQLINDQCVLFSHNGRYALMLKSDHDFLIDLGLID